LASARQLPWNACSGRGRAGLTWPLPEDLSDDALEQRLYPPSTIKDEQRPLANWAEIHRELKRPGVTLQLLWQEYREQHPVGYAYSRFCDLHRAWEKRVSPTMRQTHIAGERLFVDYAGTKLQVIDSTTGEISRPSCSSQCLVPPRSPTRKRPGRNRFPIGSARTRAPSATLAV